MIVRVRNLSQKRFRGSTLNALQLNKKKSKPNLISSEKIDKRESQ